MQPVSAPIQALPAYFALRAKITSTISTSSRNVLTTSRMGTISWNLLGGAANAGGAGGASLGAGGGSKRGACTTGGVNDAEACVGVADTCAEGADTEGPDMDGMAAAGMAIGGIAMGGAAGAAAAGGGGAAGAVPPGLNDAALIMRVNSPGPESSPAGGGATCTGGGAGTGAGRGASASLWINRVTPPDSRAACSGGGAGVNEGSGSTGRGRISSCRESGRKSGRESCRGALAPREAKRLVALAELAPASTVLVEALKSGSRDHLISSAGAAGMAAGCE